MRLLHSLAQHAQHLLRGKGRPTRIHLHVERLEERLVLHGSGCPCTVCQGLAILPMVMPSGGLTSDGPLSGIGVTSLSVPALASNPGAPVTIYLDFDGHYEAYWGSYTNATTPVFDLDGNAASFSAAELASIDEVWRRVAEDYAPFNVNVTTVNPGNFADGVGLRVAIGGSYANWFGIASGGVAYVDAFVNPSLVNTVYVFPQNLANTAKYIADSAAHEAAHAFGLVHQSAYDGSGRKTAEYNPGQTDKAPLMGDSYGAARSLWWYGPSSYGPNAFQDDMSVLARPQNGFGYRADDYGGAFATATPLPASSTPQVRQGIIGSTADVDLFAFTTHGGVFSASVSVAGVGANLDARLELYSASGQLLAWADPSNSLNASVSANLAAGSYYAAVRSHGGYGDVGQYAVTFSATAAPQPPSQPPQQPQPPQYVSPTEAYVIAVYHDVLGRMPSAGEVSIWVGAIQRGLSQQQVGWIFLTSLEKRSQFVQDCYRRYLGREADAGGLNGFVTLLTRGGREEDVIQAIVSSGEYYSRQGGTDAGFVAGLYRDLLGRSANPGDISAWTGALRSLSRYSVASAILGSDEYGLRLVNGWYNLYLQRNADSSAPAWVQALHQGTTREQIQLLLIGSAEYQQRAAARFGG